MREFSVVIEKDEDGDTLSIGAGAARLPHAGEIVGYAHEAHQGSSRALPGSPRTCQQ